MEKYLATLAILLPLSGCYTPLQLSEQTIAHSAVPSQDAALAIIGKSFTPSDTRMGMCSTAKGSVEPDTLMIDGPIVS